MPMKNRQNKIKNDKIKIIENKEKFSFVYYMVSFYPLSYKGLFVSFYKICITKRFFLLYNFSIRLKNKDDNIHK